MEFPDLGKSCSLSGCNQLDFLPFSCPHCKDIFCLDHASTIKHDCKVSGNRSNATTCPFCSETIDDNDSQWLTNHLETRCTKFVDPKSQRVPCSADVDCSEKQFLASKCKFCKGTFCLAHRHTKDHNCVSESSLASAPKSSYLAVEKAKQEIEKKRSKSNPKVEFMKLKMKALGDSSIPLAQRYYFKIHSSDSGSILMAFVNMDWSFGKCQDQLQKLLGISDCSKRFRHLESGLEIGQLSKTIKELISDGILSSNGWDELH